MGAGENTQEHASQSLGLDEEVDPQHEGAGPQVSSLLDGDLAFQAPLLELHLVQRGRGDLERGEGVS